MSQRLSVVITTAILSLAASAPASTKAFVVRIAYEVPTGCPTEGAFLRQVLQRADRARVADGNEPAREFRAVITQDSSSKIAARLEFVDSEFHKVSREIEGSSCVEVASALALITALAIDPLLTAPARQRSTQSDASEPAEKDRAAAPPSNVARAQGAETAMKPRQVEHEPGRLVPSAGVAFGAASDVAPQLAPAASLFGELASPSRSSALRLELSYSQSGSPPLNTASAAFRLATGTLEGCPWARELGKGLRLWPCVAIEAGVLHAAGHASPRLPLAKSVTTPWLSGDAIVRTTLDLSRSLDLELGVKVRVPVVRNSYVYERPLTQAYRTPVIGALLYVGLGVRFGD